MNETNQVPMISDLDEWIVWQSASPFVESVGYRGATLSVNRSGEWARVNVTPSGEREDTLSIPLTYLTPRIVRMVNEEIDYYGSKEANRD